MRFDSRRGFLLVPVAVALALIATIALMFGRESGIDLNQISADRQWHEARYVAQAGYQHMKWRLDNAACAGYTNLGATNFGSHTYSASVTVEDAVDNSPVTIAVTATLADGVSLNQSRSHVPVYQAPTSASVQPGSGGSDADVSESASTTNNGSGTTLTLDDGAGAGRHALLHFDLSSIPINGDVVAATLTMYAESNGSGATGAVSVHRVLQAWTEGGVTYSTRDGSAAWTWPDNYDTNAADTAAVGSSIGSHSWNVTDLVAGWSTGPYPNNGLLLKGNGQASAIVYTSSDGVTAANRPALSITYVMECGETPILPPPSSVTASSDTYMSSAATTTNYGASDPVLAGDSDVKRTLLQFDTSGIPAGTAIASAQLRLAITGVSGPGGAISGELNVYRVTEEWSESNATWNNRDAGTAWTTAGGAYNTTLVATSTVADGYTGTVDLDITALVQAWVDNVSPNRGLILINTTQKTVSIASGASAAQIVLRY